jgi:hypothetical protein
MDESWIDALVERCVASPHYVSLAVQIEKLATVNDLVEWIEFAFRWDTTEEGFSFWFSIYNAAKSHQSSMIFAIPFTMYRPPKVA